MEVSVKSQSVDENTITSLLFTRKNAVEKLSQHALLIIIEGVGNNSHSPFWHGKEYTLQVNLLLWVVEEVHLTVVC